MAGQTRCGEHRECGEGKGVLQKSNCEERSEGFRSGDQGSGRGAEADAGRCRHHEGAG